MLFDIYNPHANQAVTRDYVKIIEESLIKAGHQTQQVTSLCKSKENKHKGIVVIQTSTVYTARRAGYKSIIRWVQGAGEDESFMRNHSRLRYAVLSLRNWWAFGKVSFFLWCSKTMQRHYEKKFHRQYSSFYIMPCFNDEMNKEAFLEENKYTDNVFVYAGSLATWQCFEPTVALYREVEKRVDNCTFRVLVADHEKAKEILQRYGVQRYSLGFVPKEQVSKEMAKAKFGFCVREDNVVNRVATPTKLSNYIANGVMPIYSEYVEDFHSMAKDCPYCICANPGDFEKPVRRLVELCAASASPEDVYGVFTDTFGDYYSRSYHIERLSELLKKRFPS